jgi:catechol 2,3-dioxygenase-like lactoylglutathione lyase family enzyme
MNLRDIDRVVIMVRDLDKALQLFSGTLGMQFEELDAAISRRDGVRSHVCHEAHLHLISPILPLPDNAAPPMRKRVGLLQEQEALCNALTFIVDDPEAAAQELSGQAIGIQHRYARSHDYATLRMDNFVETITDERDTLGMALGFASYDRAAGTTSAAGVGPLRITGLDRVAVMVRDLDRAVELFAGKLGMRFLELSPDIAARDRAKCLVCPEAKFQLISPMLPLPPEAPPPVKKRIELLKEQPMVLVALTFSVEDVQLAERELTRLGLGIQHRFARSHDYVSIGLDNFEEVVIDERDTFGIVMGLCRYDRA